MAVYKSDVVFLTYFVAAPACKHQVLGVKMLDMLELVFSLRPIGQNKARIGEKLTTL